MILHAGLSRRTPGTLRTNVPQSPHLDVVVISDDFSGKDRWSHIEILSDAIYDLFEPIEAVAMTPVEWDKAESPVVHYARNGEVVYPA